MRRTVCILACVAMAVGMMSTNVGAQTSCYEFTARDKRLATRINTVRQDNGLRLLNLDPELSRVARKHTHEMIAAGRVRHTPSEVLQDRVTGWRALGESVVRGDSVAELMRKLRNREGHRANLLEPSWRYLGVSVKRAEGSLWMTVVYEATQDPGTTLQMPSC